MHLSALLLALSVPVSGHGALARAGGAMTRRGNTGYENDPTGRTADSFVCRHASPNNAVTPPRVQAGGTMDLVWSLSALHVGDCAVYLSYDTGSSRAAMQWFKVANYPDCKADSGRTMRMDLPSWLPAGNAVLRWDWYALHVYPSVEWYAQCVDLVVQSSSPAALSSIKTYSITSPSIYPANGNSGVGFRNPWGDGGSPGQSGWYLTGPACAMGSTLNNCADTADGTRGNTVTGGGGSTPNPNPANPDAAPANPDPAPANPDPAPANPDPVPTPSRQPTAGVCTVRPGGEPWAAFCIGAGADAAVCSLYTAYCTWTAADGADTTPANPVPTTPDQAPEEGVRPARRPSNRRPGRSSRRSNRVRSETPDGAVAELALAQAPGALLAVAALLLDL